MSDKILGVALAAGLLIVSSQALLATPKPKIKANSANYSITTSHKSSLDINISMIADQWRGKMADWWLVAKTPNGWYYYDLKKRKWSHSGTQYENLVPTYQGRLFDFDDYKITNVAGLPHGKYQLYFAVDSKMDGKIDDEDLHLDDVIINVSDDEETNTVGGASIIDVNEVDGEVELMLSAVDSIDLSKAYIHVVERDEDGNEVEVVYKGKAKKVNQSLPIKLAVVLDRSGSLNNTEEALMEQGVMKMLDMLRTGDQVEVINVATEYYIDASFRNYDANRVADAIREPSVTKGWTRIYDGIMQGIKDALAHSPNSADRNMVLVITDGEDNRSSSRLEDVIRTAKESNIPVFVVGLADESDRSDLDIKGLTYLAEETGGRYVETFSPELFTDILNSLARSLKTLYSISYESPLALVAKRTIVLMVEDGDRLHRYEREFLP